MAPMEAGMEPAGEEEDLVTWAAEAGAREAEQEELGELLGISPGATGASSGEAAMASRARAMEAAMVRDTAASVEEAEEAHSVEAAVLEAEAR